MKKLVGGLILAVMVATPTWAQPNYHIFSTPKPPSRDVLERLNLTLRWKVRIPLQGQRDGIFTAQVIPGKYDRPQLVVQTLYGTVVLLDAETGDTLWRTPVGQPFLSAQPVGYNADSFFVVRKDQLFVLHRHNGLQRVYTLDKHSKLPNYGMFLGSIPSAPPLADDDMVYLAFGNRVEALVLPVYGATEKGAPETEDSESLSASITKDSRQLELKWSAKLGTHHVEHVPLMAQQRISFLTTDGYLLPFNRFEYQEFEPYQFYGPIAHAAAQHGEMAYIGSQDYVLYALNIVKNALRWRFISSAPISRKPEATDRDVFVTPRGLGLFRLERDLGFVQWQNKSAQSFLATNHKFVYALDKTGMLLLLDYDRGTTMAQCDMRDWHFPLSNDLTDRVYFANHDGQVLCLHHRQQLAPMKIKTVERPTKKKAAETPAEEKKNNDNNELQDNGAEETTLERSWPLPTPPWSWPRFGINRRILACRLALGVSFFLKKPPA